MLSLCHRHLIMITSHPNMEPWLEVITMNNFLIESITLTLFTHEKFQVVIFTMGNYDVTFGFLHFMGKY